jgi:trypsin
LIAARRIRGVSALLLFGALLAALLLPANAAASQPRTQIAGGAYAASDAWPWVTALTRTSGSGGDFGRTFCTATLIAPDRVLTAAHCVNDKTASDIQALVGRKNLLNEWEGQRFGVREILIHPKAYLPRTGIHTNHAFYDIAVLLLAGSSTVQAAPIGDATTWASPPKGWAMGWGHVSYEHDPETWIEDPRLKTAELDLLDDAQCNAAINVGVQHFFPDIHLCAYDIAEVDCITHGDSGGPLMVWSNGAWRLIGVTSFYPLPNSCGPIGFAWVAGPSMRDWALTAMPPPLPPPPPPPLPTVTPITIKLARGYVKAFIGQRTNGTVRNRRMRCKKLSATVVRCGVSWRIGPKRFSGRARLFHYLGGTTTYWSYSFRGKRVKLGCRRGCVRGLVW